MFSAMQAIAKITASEADVMPRPSAPSAKGSSMSAAAAMARSRWRGIREGLIYSRGLRRVDFEVDHVRSCPHEWGPRARVRSKVGTLPGGAPCGDMVVASNDEA